MAFPHVNTKATNITLTPEIEDRLEKKLHALEKFISEGSNCVCDVELEKVTGSQTGKIYRAEINFEVDGRLFRAEATEESIEVAIDRVKNELKRELRKARDKEKSLLRRGSQRIKDMLRFGK